MLKYQISTEETVFALLSVRLEDMTERCRKDWRFKLILTNCELRESLFFEII